MLRADDRDPPRRRADADVAQEPARDPVIRAVSSGTVSGVTAALTALVGREIETLTLAEAAEHLDVPRTRISQMIKQGQLLGVREGDRWIVPAAFLVETGVVKGLPGLITVLRDGGYTDAEILRWLFLEDPTLPGAPIEALRSDRGGEVKRRAQAMAF
jgi:excisionase family DNA binding protein